MKRVQSFIIFITMVVSTVSLFGANINIPSLELISRGVMENDLFVIDTDGELNMIIHGGDKFGGKVVLGFDNRNLEQGLVANSLDGLALLSATVAVKNLFSSPLTIKYFIGLNDYLGAGTAFSELFGAAPIVTHYSGFLYFPEGVTYQGIHPVKGSGIELSLIPINNIFSASAYFYQDNNFSVVNPDLSVTALRGYYSYDLRFLLNFPNIKLELFGGGTFPISTYGYYRGGLLFNAYTPAGGFLMQLGVPRWDPLVDTLGIDLFYMLFEVNIQLGIMKIIPTVFIHPGYYSQKPTGEEGIIDVNLNFQVGDIQEHLVSGGFETNVSFAQASVEGLTVKLAPYLKLVSPGVEWLFKVNTKVFASPYPTVSEMFEGFIGIKAVF